MEKLKKIDLSKIPLIAILVGFILTYFVYKDFDIRMIYGYAFLGFTGVVYTIANIIKHKPFVKFDLFEKIYLILPVMVIISLFRTDVVKDYELLTYIIAMVIGSGYILISRLEKKEINVIFKMMYVGAMIFAAWEFINLLFPSVSEFWLSHISDFSRKFNEDIMRKGFGISIGASLPYVYYVLILGIAVCIANFVVTKKKRNIVSILFFLFAMVVVNRRGELLSTLFILLCSLIIFDNPKKRKKHIIIGAAVLISLAVLFVLCIPILKNVDFLFRYIYTIENIFNGKDFSSGRFELYDIAFNAFKEHPVLGIGWGNFAKLIPDSFKAVHGDDVKNVHNIYLQFLCETGIVGGVIIIGALIALFVFTIKVLNKLKYSDDKDNLKLAIVSFIIQLFFLTTGMLDPVFSKRIFWFFYPLAIKFIATAYNAVKDDFKRKKSKSEEVSIKKNFVMNVILTVSSVAFPMISFPYISRVLSPEGTGIVSFATSFVFYFYTFAQLGIPTYGIRACAKVRDDKEKLTKTVHELLFIQVIMSVISYVLYIAAILFIPKLRTEVTLYLIVGVKIFFEAIGMEWLYKALEQYSYITKRSVIFKFIALILMFLLVKNPADYKIYAALLIFADTASNIMNIFVVHKFIDIKWLGNYSLKKHFKSILVFFSMVCATTIYTHLDVIMLGFMTSNVDVGYYNVSMKIKTVLVSIVTSLGAVLLPRTSYYVENKKMEEFWSITKKAMRFVVLLSIPLMLYFIVFARQGVLFIAGNDYLSAINPLKILMPTLVIIGITNILGIQILVPLGKEKFVLYSQIAGAVVDVIFNAILIPIFASTGAAIGTLFAEFTVLVVQVIALRKYIVSVFKEIEFGKLFLSLIPSILITVGISKYIDNVFLSLVVTACSFFGIYGVLLLLTKEKFVFDLFNQVITKVRRKV